MTQSNKFFAESEESFQFLLGARQSQSWRKVRDVRQKVAKVAVMRIGKKERGAS